MKIQEFDKKTALIYAASTYRVTPYWPTENQKTALFYTASTYQVTSYWPKENNY